MLSRAGFAVQVMACGKLPLHSLLKFRTEILSRNELQEESTIKFKRRSSKTEAIDKARAM